MRSRFSAVLLGLALLGLFAGARMGGRLTNAQYAQTGGTSSSGGGGGNGTSSSSANNSDGTSGSSNSDSDGSSGSSESDGTSSSGTGGGGGGTGGGTGGGGTGGTTPGGAGTTVPGGAGIPQPTSPTSVPPSRVGEGLPTSCPESAGGNIRCFDIGDNDGVDAVRIPDGIGGFVIVPIAPVPVVDVDTGTSTSAASNIDNRIQVNVETGDVIRVERRIDQGRQAAFATLALLLLAVTAAASIASYLHIRKLGR